MSTLVRKSTMPSRAARLYGTFYLGVSDRRSRDTKHGADMVVGLWVIAIACVLSGGVLTIQDRRRIAQEPQESLSRYVPRCQWMGCHKVASGYVRSAHCWVCQQHHRKVIQ